MPLLHRKPFEPNPPPDDLKPEDEIFYCPLTKEVFADYDAFFERTILCNSLVWSCAITYRQNMTYQEALDCEHAARKKFDKFPKPMHKPVLYLVKLMQRSRIEELTDCMFSFIKKRFFIGEEITVKFKSAKYECRILDVISTKPPSPSGQGVNGHENGGVSSDEEDDDKPLAKFIKPKVLDVHEVKYQVKVIGPSSDPIKIVPWTAMRRTLKREQCKLFLKTTCEQDQNMNRIYFVKDSVAKRLNLSNTKWEDIFTGPEPSFAEQSPKSKKTIDHGDGQKAQKAAERKAKIREEHMVQEMKRQEKEMKLEIKKKEAEESRRLKLLAIEQREQRKRETRERLERMKAEREVEREEIKEVKRRLAEYKKEWRKMRDDLECDDLKDIPAPQEIATNIPPHLFGDMLGLLEFFHTFEALFDAKDEFPKGVSLDLLGRAILTEDQEGPLCDFLFFFLSHLFSTHVEEEGETFYELEDGDEELAKDASESRTAETLVAAATICATWPLKYQGCAINKLELDSYTVSEVLRLYLLSSAARVPADSRSWRTWQRGFYSATDDTPLRMRLDQPELIQKLAHVSIFNFTPEEKIEILSCLSNQLLSYVTPREFLDDMAEKYFAAISEYREDKANEKKRERDAMAERLKWKNEQREKRLKFQENVMRGGQNNLNEGNVSSENSSVFLPGNKDDDSNKLMTTEEQMEYLRIFDEEERVVKEAWQFREGKHFEAIAKYQKYKVRPLGEDRFYRRYWVLNCIPGILVEEFPEDILTGDLLSVKVAQQGQPSWSWTSQTETPANGETTANTGPQILHDIQNIKSEHNIAQINGNSSVNIVDLTESTSSTPQNGSVVLEEPQVTTPEKPNHPETQGTAHKWSIYSEKEEIERLMSSLNRRGFRESKLRESLSYNRQKIFSDLNKCPVNELCRKPSAKELEQRKIKSLACEKAIELALRDQLLDLESRIFEGTLGGIKEEDGYNWMERVTHGQEYDEEFRESLLESMKTDEESLPNGMVNDNNDEESMEAIESQEESKDLCSSEITIPPEKPLQEEENDEKEVKMEIDEGIENTRVNKTSSRTITDLALALLQVERGIDRKYLKAPLGFSEDIARRRTRSKGVQEPTQEEKEEKKRESEELLRRWECSLLSSTSISQVSLHLATLNRCIIWARSVLNASCKICKRKGDAEKMLLCDACDRGHHMYCLKPALKNVPSGNWYCPECKPKNLNRLSPRKARTQSFSQQEASSEEETEEEEEETEEEEEDDDDEEVDEEEESSDEEEEDDNEEEEEEAPPRRVLKYKIPRKPAKAVITSRGRKSKANSPEASTSKSRGRSAGRAGDTGKVRGRGADTGKRARSHSERRQKRAALDDEIDQKASVNRRRSTGVWKDLNACQTLLKELMEHKDSWPFLLPVSKKQVPDYYEIIKYPMDFSTMENKFKSIEYTDPAEFIADVKLIFSNCLVYNMPRSVLAKASVHLSGLFEKKLREYDLDRYKDGASDPPSKRRKS